MKDVVAAAAAPQARLVYSIDLKHANGEGAEVCCIRPSADGTALFCGLDDGRVALLSELMGPRRSIEDERTVYVRVVCVRAVRWIYFARRRRLASAGPPARRYEFPTRLEQEHVLSWTLRLQRNKGLAFDCAPRCPA